MLYWLGRFYLWLVGWRMEGKPPDCNKFVLIAAPHTSNWDLPLMLSLASLYHLRIHWIGKHTLFRFPFGPFMRWTGGISVDRRSRGNTVEQIVHEFQRRDKFALAVPVEGTRSRAECWKSGFYYIALEAHVPVVLGFLDYKRKVGGFGPSFMPTGNVEQDTKVLRDFYESITPKYPECYGPIRFRPREEQTTQPPPGPAEASEESLPKEQPPVENPPTPRQPTSDS